MSWQNLTQEQLEALPTPRLLNIYKLARNGTWCRCDCDSRCDCEESRAPAQRIKAMLDEREHVGETVNNKTRDPKLLNRKPYQGCVPRYGYIERMRLKSKGMIVTKQGTIRPAVGPIAFPEEAVGRQIMKVSGKPFKSKGLYNTVSGVTENPHTDRVAFTYEEDDSVVDAHICKLRA